MAIYHLAAKVISRTSGRSAVAAAAYRSGERLLNERDGRAHDFRARSGVEATFIAGPEGVPSWAFDRQALWSAVELHEKRSNATTAREWEVALPAELDANQREALAGQFAAAMVKRFGIVADCAIHAPNAEGDSRNHHLHMLTTTREVTAKGFGAKTRELDGGKGRGNAVVEIRGLWADLCNRALEAAQINERVDHRSHAAIRTEAQEAAEAQERAKDSLNPIGKRQRVQEATEAALEARKRVQGLPETPGTHKGPQRTAQERREAREQAEKERQEREAARDRERAALLKAAERNPLSAGTLTERVLEEAQKALREMQEIGVRAFIRERLSQVTEAANQLLERLLGLGLVERDRYGPNTGRAAADTFGVQVSAAARRSPEVAASVAWAAAASEHDRPVLAVSSGHWADGLPCDVQYWVQDIERQLEPDALSELQIGDGLKAFEDWDGTAHEKLDWAETYLKAEIAAGIDRADALEAVGYERQILMLDEERARERRFEREAQEQERDRGDDLEWE